MANGRPSIAREIAVKVEPLCSYESGTKVDLTIKNVGAVQFSELTITLGPESRIQAGKRVIRWERLNPDQEEHVEVPLSREEAVVEKETRVTGGVRVRKTEGTEQQTVRESPRHEDVDIDESGKTSHKATKPTAPDTGEERL